MKSILREYKLNKIKLSKKDCEVLYNIISAKTDFKSQESKFGYLHELVVDKFHNPNDYLNIWTVKSQNKYDGHRDRLDGTSIKTNCSKTLEDDPDRHVIGSTEWVNETTHEALFDQTVRQFKNNPKIEFHTFSAISRKFYTDIISKKFEDIEIDFKFITTNNAVVLDYLNLGKKNLYMHHVLQSEGKRLVAYLNYEYLLNKAIEVPIVQPTINFTSYQLSVPAKYNLTTKAKDPQRLSLSIPKDVRAKIADHFSLKNKARKSFLNNDRIRPSLKKHPAIEAEIIKFLGKQKIGSANFILKCMIYVDKAGRTSFDKDECSVTTIPSVIPKVEIVSASNNTNTATISLMPKLQISNSALDRLISLRESDKITDQTFNLALTKIKV
jgi:hypothetical protein